MRARKLVAAGLVVVLAASAGAALAKVKKGKAAPRGPYPSLGACTVFPKSGLGPGAPAGADESAWNQDISQAPLDPASDAIIAFINEHGGDSLHPTSDRRASTDSRTP